MTGDRDYKVTDKRGARDDDEPAADEPVPSPAPAPAPAPKKEQASASQGLPEIDFATFVLSLASSAIAHMHGLDDKGEPSLPPNLPLARQSIDILSLIQTKTKGNLSGEEERLVDHLLYDLRLQFVAATGKK